MLVVPAANSLLEGAAPPGAQTQPAACAPIRTARLFITTDIPRCHLSPLVQCRSLVHPGPAGAPPLQAAAPLGVAGVALGAAVHVVGAADGLLEGAASPSPGAEPAARVPIGTARLLITLDITSWRQGTVRACAPSVGQDRGWLLPGGVLPLGSAARGAEPPREVQVEWTRSQVVPWGQQCCPSLQHTAFCRGQQPYCVGDSWQQVAPSGHAERPSGHSTWRSATGAGGWCFQAGKAVLRGTSVSPVGDTQRPWVKSQMVAWGQQCTLSAQHEAWGMGQHPQAPLLVTQHVASSGHSDWPSGQGTARGARSVTQDSPSALQWDPRGQQWWPPAQGTLSGSWQLVGQDELS